MRISMGVELMTKQTQSVICTGELSICSAFRKVVSCTEGSLSCTFAAHTTHSLLINLCFAWMLHAQIIKSMIQMNRHCLVHLHDMLYVNIVKQHTAVEVNNKTLTVDPLVTSVLDPQLHQGSSFTVMSKVKVGKVVISLPLHWCIATCLTAFSLKINKEKVKDKIPYNNSILKR